MICFQTIVFAPRSTFFCASCSRKQRKTLPSSAGNCPQGRKRYKTSVVPPWFTVPSRARPRSCGSGFLPPLLTAGRCNGRSRRGLSTLALRPRGSETIFSSLFPALFHRPGSLEGSMRKPTLLFTAIFVILVVFYPSRRDLSTPSTKFFGRKLILRSFLQPLRHR